MEQNILGDFVLSSVNRPYADRRTGGSEDHFRTHRLPLIAVLILLIISVKKMLTGEDKRKKLKMPKMSPRRKQIPLK